MADFSFLKQYIFLEKDETAGMAKHSFYKLADTDVVKAQERLGYDFPGELKSFYDEVGYGFMCNTDDTLFDRFLDPGSVADFALCEGMYQCNDEDEYYDAGLLVFFEVSEVSYIAMDLNAVNDKGECPIYYFEYKIADSLEEFLRKMDEKTDYYLDKTAD